MSHKESLLIALSRALAAASGLNEQAVRTLLTEPKNRDFGDLAFPCFTLAKTLKKSPPACAVELGAKLVLPQGVHEAYAAGPFLNFRFDRSEIVRDTLTNILSPQPAPRRPQTVIVEYSSPNIAKPFHVGHLRATLIGNCLDRVYRKLGWNTVSINHLGDWGTQFGYVWAGCKLWGYPAEPTVASLVELYRRATALKEEQENRQGPDPDCSGDVNEIARGFFIDLEKGEDYAVDFWRRCVEISLDYLKKT
ncbi:MAG TPA: arginine--tRNA ligase, partial [Oligoflexia bacterium]|nr:arginine--tRNA ligase [Oligoflexia bacterium]